MAHDTITWVSILWGALPERTSNRRAAMAASFRSCSILIRFTANSCCRRRPSPSSSPPFGITMDPSKSLETLSSINSKAGTDADAVSPVDAPRTCPWTGRDARCILGCGALRVGEGEEPVARLDVLLVFLGDSVRRRLGSGSYTLEDDIARFSPDRPRSCLATACNRASGLWLEPSKLLPLTS